MSQFTESVLLQSVRFDVSYEMDWNEVHLVSVTVEGCIDNLVSFLSLSTKQQLEAAIRQIVKDNYVQA